MVAQQAKPTRQYRRMGAVDDETILALANAGKTQDEIAQIMGDIDRSTVSRRLKHLTPRKSTEIFKSHRADILAEFQRKFMLHCNSADIKKMISSRGMTDFGILYDKERIERGLSDSDSKPLVVIQIKSDRNTIAITSPNAEAIDVPSTRKALVT